MKRSVEGDDVREAPQLPPELWDHIISSPCLTKDTKTITSVFLLDKTISSFLLNSVPVMKRVLSWKFNKLFEGVDSEEERRDGWFQCDGCYKLVLANHTRTGNYMEKYCQNCCRKCLGCGKTYNRSLRYFHRDCVSYPAPFTPHDSDYDSPSY